MKKILVLLVAAVSFFSFTTVQQGIIGQLAPEWNIKKWIDAEGNPTSDINISDYKGQVVYLKMFKHGCPGCHSIGFPVLQHLHSKYKNSDDVAFLGIQTAFSGKGYNSFDKLKINQDDYNLPIPFGHDPGVTADQYPDVMIKYQTRGTPWVVIVDKKGVVRYSDFRIDPTKAEKLIEKLRAE